MKNVKIRRKGRGFTLVELVIVIAVIAVLSAVLIPVFGNVVSNAKASALRANIVTLNSDLMLRAIKDDNRSSYSVEEINKILDDMDFDLASTPKGYSIWYDQSVNNLRLLKNDSAFSSATPLGNESGVRKAYAATDPEIGNRAVEALNPYNRDLLYIDRTNKTINNLLAEIKGDVTKETKDGVEQVNKKLGLIASTESANKNATPAQMSSAISTAFKNKYKELATELKIEDQSDALVASFDFDHTLFIGSEGMYLYALSTAAQNSTIDCKNALVEGSVTEIRKQELKQRTADKDRVQINMSVSIIVPNRVEFIESAAFASIGTKATETTVTVEVNPGTTIIDTAITGAKVTVKNYSTILDENSIKYTDANIVYGRDYECVYSDTCQYFYMSTNGEWLRSSLETNQSLNDVQSDAMVKYLAPEFVIHNEEGVDGFFSKVTSLDRLYLSSNKVGYLTKYTAIVLLVDNGVTKGYKFSNIGYMTNLNAYTFESYDPIKHTGRTDPFQNGKGRIEIRLPEGATSLYNYKDRLSVKINYKPVVNTYSKQLLDDGTPYYIQSHSEPGSLIEAADTTFTDGKFVLEFDCPSDMTMGNYSTLTSQIESVEVYYKTLNNEQKLILVRKYN